MLTAVSRFLSCIELSVGRGRFDPTPEPLIILQLFSYGPIISRKSLHDCFVQIKFLVANIFLGRNWKWNVWYAWHSNILDSFHSGFISAEMNSGTRCPNERPPRPAQARAWAACPPVLYTSAPYHTYNYTACPSPKNCRHAVRQGEGIGSIAGPLRPRPARAARLGPGRRPRRPVRL